ncbi:MAG: MarR family winged helix-turn-helix transcriptional regulator [Spirochaetaceae bacterium]|nr:MarR family winged helix-turn-helix transcriptional regulator [Spirochaetaceae bacterium]
MDLRCDELADPTVATFRRLLRTTLSMKRAMGAVFAQAGLTGAQFHTLVRIPDQGIPVTRLAARSWADPGNASGVVDRLERDGLVERQPAAHDRRVVLVHVTPAGRALMDRLWPQYVDGIHRIMEPLSAEDRERLNELLDRLAGRENEDVESLTAAAD